MDKLARLRNIAVTSVAALAAAAAPCTAPASPVANVIANPGFESTDPWVGGPPGWEAFQHIGPLSYEFVLDERDPKVGRRSFRVTSIGPEAFGSLRQTIDGKPWAGRRLRLSAWIKGEGIPEARGQGIVLVLTAYRGEVLLANTRLRTREPQGTFGWRRESIELEIPPRTDRIDLGATLLGRGKAWLDDFVLETVDTAGAAPVAAPDDGSGRVPRKP